MSLLGSRGESAASPHRTQRTQKKGPHLRAAALELLLLFASFFPAALACQGFFNTLLLAGFQVKGVALNLLYDVFLLYLALETAQRIFEGLTLLQPNLCQRNYTPKLVPDLDPIVIASFCPQVKGRYADACWWSGPTPSFSSSSSSSSSVPAGLAAAQKNCLFSTGWKVSGNDRGNS